MKSWGEPWRFDVNASSRPFGDHRGVESIAAFSVSLFKFDPSVWTVKISVFPFTLPQNAIVLPSGEKDGDALSCVGTGIGRLSAPSFPMSHRPGVSFSYDWYTSRVPSGDQSGASDSVFEYVMRRWLSPSKSIVKISFTTCFPATRSRSDEKAIFVRNGPGLPVNWRTRSLASVCAMRRTARSSPEYFLLRMGLSIPRSQSIASTTTFPPSGARCVSRRNWADVAFHASPSSRFRGGRLAFGQRAGSATTKTPEPARSSESVV